MGYFGDWGNLSKNLDRVKQNIADRKSIKSAYTVKKTPINKAAQNRKRISLVKIRDKDIGRARLIYLLAALLMISLLYFLI